MITPTRLIYFLLMLITCGSSGDASARVLILGLAPDSKLDSKAVSTEIKRVFLGLEPGDTLLTYNTFSRQQISRLDLPMEKRFKYPNVKLQVGGSQLRAILGFVENSYGPDRPSAIPLASNLGEIGFLRFVADTIVSDSKNKDIRIMLIGSGLHYDVKDPGSQFLNGRFPSDGHIRQTDTASPFGTSNRPMALKDVQVHHAFLDADFETDVHRNKVQRFWSLYLANQGGTLATFSPSLPDAVRRFLEGTTQSGEVYALDPADTAVVMRRVVRGTLEASNRQEAPAIFSADAIPQSNAPAKPTGAVTFGATWAADVDIDVHVRCSESAPFLNFHNRQSEEGEFPRDYRSSPDNAYEIVQIRRVDDIRQCQFYLNYYSGLRAAPSGTARIMFDANPKEVWEVPFEFSAAATGGNKAAGLLEGKMTEPFWLRIDVAKVLRLSPADSRSTAAR